MAFKMKGSSYKMGGVKTKATMAYMKSPLHQNPNLIIAGLKDKLATTSSLQDDGTYKDNATLNVLDPFNGVKKSADYNAIATQSTKGKGKNKYYDKRVIGQAQWIRENFGQGHQNNKKALRAFYQAHNQDQDVVEETPVVENKVQREDKGVDNQSEFSKAVNKGYFNKGKGSTFISTKPKAEDFATFEEFQAANRKHEMNNPGLKTQ
tara:strand:- start:27 stop:647 length:621 start_codon:yes stop_codon:yes gene_type:complete